MDRKLAEARRIALKKGIISKPEELQLSKAKNKRFALVKDGLRTNFGLWDGSGHAYIDHQDNSKKLAWQARHSKIKQKDGRFAYKVKDSPEYLAYNILWP